MELYEVMRTTFAAREFTDQPVSDGTIAKILEEARFAPSGAAAPRSTQAIRRTVAIACQRECQIVSLGNLRGEGGTAAPALEGRRY